MAIISTEDLIVEANLGRETEHSLLVPHIEAAEMELKRILGDEKYLTITAYQSSADEGEAGILNEVRKGAVYLAMSYAVYSLNMETQGSGIVKMKGWDKSRSELLSRNEIEELSAYFRSRAMLFLQPYIEKSEPDINLGNIYIGAL